MTYSNGYEKKSSIGKITNGKARTREESEQWTEKRRNITLINENVDFKYTPTEKILEHMREEFCNSC